MCYINIKFNDTYISVLIMAEEESLFSTTEDTSNYNESSRGPGEHVVAISIESHKLEEGMIKKHVVYNIQGQDTSGLFVISRRFKEFVVLRNVLSAM